MSSPSSTQDPNDLILAQFMADLERRGRVVLDEWVRRYPDRAQEFAGFLQLHDAIGDASEVGDESVPERLGDFRIVRLLARGGMGEVYEAVQEHLGRRVAIKVIRRGRVSEQARDRFLREQKVLARLHQTHVVPIHFAGEEGRLQYFVMPYIEGAALHHVVRTAQQLDSTQAGERTPTLAELAALMSPAGESAADGGGEMPATIEPCAEEPQADGAKRVSPPRLSPAYFRSVASVMADAAEAVEHAHGAGILHRDLKPSNLMVDRQGQCWLIDFGLAAFMRETAPGDPVKEPRGPEPTTASGVAGTLEYMSPEQLDGKVDVRTDVWGLGATLYELLTLTRAFEAAGVPELCATIRSREPASPRQRVMNVPHDLEAICRKAMRKAPGQRYQAAGEFAEDLRRWLRHEPTVARPARVPRRMWLWGRRNPGWAAAGILVMLAISTLLWALISNQQVLDERAKANEAKRLAAERMVSRQEIQQFRLTNRTSGWSDQVWRRVKDATEFDTSLDLRNLGTASLAGLDARQTRRFEGPASSVAYHRGGKRLLMGGTDNRPARLWDGTLNAPVSSGLVGHGPVAFAADDTPLQLVLAKDETILLWDVEKQRRVKEFKLPPLAEREVPLLALAPNGSLAAASAQLVGGKATVRIWETKSGKLLHEFEQLAIALAFTPDGKFVASGDEEGKITVWPLPVGEPIARLRADRATAVLALDFGRDARRKAEEARPGRGWLLAAGDASGTVTIWDIERGEARSFCRGSDYHVHTMALSPDGMTLASAGQGEAKLWDVASGGLLLNVMKTGWFLA